jgi:hypothetical protein
MENRQDRINFPPVDSESLWTGISPVRDEVKKRVPQVSTELCTPDICSPRDLSPCDVNSQGVNFFKARELAGLITPARTPSDILYRGPLYQSSSDEESAETSRPPTPVSPIGEKTEAIIKKASLDFNRESSSDIHSQLLFHRSRQEAIKGSIADFESKMSSLLDWHREQERELLIRLNSAAPSTGSCSGRSSLRRGRSKLSERLYEAIDLNSA